MIQHISQNDPRAEYVRHKDIYVEKITSILDSGRYILGEQVKNFEKEFAEYIGVNYAIGVANGTDAIELALRSRGIGWRDSVVTVAYTATATVAAIMRTGAQPLFVDIDPQTYTMAPNSLENLLRITHEKPKAVIPVHLYGHPANMEAIRMIAKKYDMFIIEDCAQAHGAAIDGCKVGSFGDAGAFSFYPTKNLGAFGDGGCIVTNDKLLAERLYLIREYGWNQRHISSIQGVNSRLDELQAAILHEKLKRLDYNNEKRIRIANEYTRFLHGISGISVPYIKDEVRHVFHQYVIRVNNGHRNILKKEMLHNSIETAIHYPVPVHKQVSFSKASTSCVPLCVSERTATEVLSLPMYPELAQESIQQVVRVIADTMQQINGQKENRHKLR